MIKSGQRKSTFLKDVNLLDNAYLHILVTGKSLSRISVEAKKRSLSCYYFQKQKQYNKLPHFIWLLDVK